MNTVFEVKGFEDLSEIVAKIGNPQKLFDSDFARNARQLSRQMIEKTPKKTGTTARGWSTPKKLYYSSYVVSNETNVQGVTQKYNLALILDKGRKEVRPIRTQNLYIPLSQKGMSKRAGAKIPKGLVYGKDYILAKKSRATTGRNFIKPATDRQGKFLLNDMIATIKNIQAGRLGNRKRSLPSG